MRTLLALSKRSERKIVNPSTVVPMRLSSGTITAMARVASTPTLVGGVAGTLVEATTTENPHGFWAGIAVVLAGAVEAQFNGEFVISEVPASNKFRFFCAGATTPATTLSSLTYYGIVPFRHATLLGLKDWRTANVANVYIGGSATDDQQPYVIEPYAPGGTGENYLPTRTGHLDFMENLADYYLDVGTANDGLIIRFI